MSSYVVHERQNFMPPLRSFIFFSIYCVLRRRKVGGGGAVYFLQSWTLLISKIVGQIFHSQLSLLGPPRPILDHLPNCMFSGICFLLQTPFTSPGASSSWPSDLYCLKAEPSLHFHLLLLFPNLVIINISMEFSLFIDWATFCCSEYNLSERNPVNLVQVAMEVVDGTQRNFIEIGTTGNTLMPGLHGRWNWRVSLDLNSSGSLNSHRVHRRHLNALSSLCFGHLLCVLNFWPCTNPSNVSPSQIQIPFLFPKSKSKSIGLTHLFPLFPRSVASPWLILLWVRCSPLLQSDATVLGCLWGEFGGRITHTWSIRCYAQWQVVSERGVFSKVK